MPQTLTEIRDMLERAGLQPQKRLGQNFMVDKNLLAAVVALAEVGDGDGVLEIGPGTGTLTEALLAAGATVLAVELDKGLAALLRQRLTGRERFRLLACDVLAGKHRIEPRVLAAMRDLPGDSVHLVSNVPYNIAVPVVCEFLLSAVAAERGQAGGVPLKAMTMTVQREVAERLSAGPGSGSYGPASVLVALLGQVHLGKLVPASAFWPRPKVASRMLRIDVRPPSPETVPDTGPLTAVVQWAFTHRRKKIGSPTRRRALPFEYRALGPALAAAGIDPAARPDRIDPARFARLAAELAAGGQED